MLDFNDYYQPLRELLISSVLKFELEQPSIQWSMLAFEVTAHSGCGFLSIDTEEHSNVLVQQYSDDAARDVFGPFNNSPADCKYPWYAEFQFSEWQQAYLQEETYRAKSVLGKAFVISVESWELSIDTTHAQLVFQLLQKVVEDTVEDIKRLTKNRAPLSRIGFHIGEDFAEWFIVV